MHNSLLGANAGNTNIKHIAFLEQFIVTPDRDGSV